MIYEYMCRECDHRWEAEQRIMDPPMEVCPACQKHAAMRLISKTSFILNGEGWYAKGGY